MERQAFSCVELSLPGLRITMPVAHIHTTGYQLERIAVRGSLTFLAASHLQTRCMVPTGSISGSGAVLIY
jgi:hypothetical protein